MNEDYSSLCLEELPIISLRNVAVFPGTGIKLVEERPRAVAALMKCLRGESQAFVVRCDDIFGDAEESEEAGEDVQDGQDDGEGALEFDESDLDELLSTLEELIPESVKDLQPGLLKGRVVPLGAICTADHYFRIPGGGIVAMVSCVCRASILEETDGEDCRMASVMPLSDEPVRMSPKVRAMLAAAFDLYRRYAELTGGPTAPAEPMEKAGYSGDVGGAADAIAQNMSLRADQKQLLMELLDPVKRLRTVTDMLRAAVEVMDVERDIGRKVDESMAHAHREQILREHLRVLQSELGEDDYSEIEEYKKKILALNLSREITEKLLKENDRLSKQPMVSAEASVIRAYLDAVLELPWNRSTKERLDIADARRILDRDHFGLDKVKDRVIESLAVRCVAPDKKGGIICLVGPPGVGKTSIALSIADAMNRKLARMSLGGVHDEADIRGHRKTYIGAMPGRIMAAMTQAGTNNPLMVLDEIDKLGHDYKGDPASALLEALDPEQNSAFRDHFLEVPFDLSKTMFIATANTVDTIPRPLLDRMEVIEITSYTDEEKVQIAKKHLIPKQRKKHGLTAKSFRVADNAIRELISGYTRESGVRQLEREIAHLCRKADLRIASGEGESLSVTQNGVSELLGPRKYKPERESGRDRVGVVNGLAWTEVGGEKLEVECACLDGTGKLELTGNLGNVMRESAQAAVTCIRARCDKLGIDPEFYKKKDIHIHFPEGAVPKDGPSAGIAIACAVISALTGTPARSGVAMTGEITITGRVLPIGGLREKTMAALRYGMDTVILPADNLADLEEIDQTVRGALKFVPVFRLDDVLDHALALPDASAAPKRSPRRGSKGDRTEARQ